MSYAIVDIETTGLSKHYHKITEIAAVQVNNGEVSKEFQTLINPQVKIPSFITKLTGIDNEMVKNAPTIKEVMPAFVKFLGKNVFVAHNASFDYGFLDYNFAYYHNKKITNQKLCTRKLANRILHELPGKNLNALCHYFGIQNKNAHRAMADVYATFGIFNNFLDILKQKGIVEVQDILNFEKMPKCKCINYSKIKSVKND